MKSRLIQLESALDALLNELASIKDSIENGQSPFVENEYFNLAVALERMKEAKERISGIINCQKSKSS